MSTYALIISAPFGYEGCGRVFDFTVAARITVRTALTVEESRGASHTPQSPHTGDRIKSEDIGNTIVPNNETVRERAGRSRAVK